MSEVFNADVLNAINRALSAENVVTREGEEPVYCNVNNETREIEYKKNEALEEIESKMGLALVEEHAIIIK